jgi:hypothetical protein
VQAKDLEIGRMMEKLNKKKVWEPRRLQSSSPHDHWYLVIFRKFSNSAS